MWVKRFIGAWMRRLFAPLAGGMFVDTRLVISITTIGKAKIYASMAISCASSAERGGMVAALVMAHPPAAMSEHMTGDPTAAPSIISEIPRGGICNRAKPASGGGFKRKGPAFR